MKNYSDKQDFMKKRKLWLIFICWFAFNNLNIQAQLNDFNISEYKLPDIKRQGIDLNFNLSGNQYTTDINQQSKKYNVSNSFNGNYFLTVHKRKFQSYNYAGIDYSMGLYNQESDTISKLKSHGISTNTRVSSYNRFYIQNEYFILLEFSGKIGFYNNKSTSDSYNHGQWLKVNESQIKRNNYYTNGAIGFGKGRIEPVEDARQALYILEELKNNNRLKRDPSHEEIMKIAENISKIKNERMLDSRIKKITELKYIDSILVQMDLISNADMLYFSGLNDMWDYGSIQQRSAGYRIELSYRPSYAQELQHNTENYDSYSNDFNADTKYFKNQIQLSVSWQKPVKKMFQSDFHWGASYMIRNTDFNYSSEVSKRIQTSLNYSFAIYPNTRTSFNIGISLNGNKLWITEINELTDAINYESSSYSLSPFLNLYYYFSPQISLNCTYDAYSWFYNNQDNNGKDGYTIQNMLNISLLYSIF